ncbi:MAG: hypothetical protein KDD11_04810 [Acidobacteria bacterium]|nr:hypothetical protein [Acidobacteriota bacterium]
MIIVRVLVLIALVRVLFEFRKPLLCAVIYAGLRLVFAAMVAVPSFGMALPVLAAFVLAWLYFWLLLVVEDTVFKWPLLVAGLLIGVV